MIRQVTGNVWRCVVYDGVFRGLCMGVRSINKTTVTTARGMICE